MANEKDNKEDFDNQLLITDVLIRLTAMETVLIDSGLIKKEDLDNKIAELTEKLTQIIINNMNQSKVQKEN